MGKICQICGKNSGMYPLCKGHLQMKEQGIVIKNEQTGKWEVNLFKNNKQSENQNINNEIKNVIIVNEKNKSKCITCGMQTDGLLFCTNCYHKYKNKELLFRITNCSNIELLDNDYEGKYTCKDGHIVKSKSEREIDNFLFDNEIKHIYEKEVAYGMESNEILHPDFCLPDYLGKGKNVYIEHWGYNENNIHYTKTKKFKMPIYQRLCKDKEMTLICTYEKTDANKMYSILEKKLNKKFIKENEINYEQ